jgi:molybdopterin-guanine dinucleotide biosynthesis adapter protein
MRIYGVTGWKNSGKTHLMVRLVAELTRRGLAVSTVKHAHHGADTDHPGTDSYRHREAGARQVVLASPARWALMHELRDEPEPPLDRLLEHLDPVDPVLVEGYKSAPHPKVEAHRTTTGRPLIAPGNPTIRLVASDGRPDTRLPVLPLDDTGAIAGFILSEVGL